MNNKSFLCAHVVRARRIYARLLLIGAILLLVVGCDFLRGPAGPTGPAVQIQFSADNTDWHDGVQAGDQWIRFRASSTTPWSAGIRLTGQVGAAGAQGQAGQVGAAGDLVSIQYSPDNRAWSDAFTAATRYIRFRVGSGAWTIGVLFAGVSECGKGGTCTLTRTTKVASGTTNGPTLANTDNFGSSIANVGDLDGGGTVIAVGAPGDDTGGDGRGAIYLLSYDSSGTLTGTTKVASGTTNGPTLANRDNFGSSIADVGDLDGGGGTVIAVGAPGDDTGRMNSNRGAIYLLSYNSSGTLTGTTKVASGTTNGPTLVDIAGFGSGIADVGDLDGGGGTVIAVGASTEDGPIGFGVGAMYLLSYDSSGTLTGTTKVTEGTTNGPTLSSIDGFGESVADVGALDGGGGRVIAVGTEGDDTGGANANSNRGAIYLLSYDSSGTLTGTTKVAHGTTNGPTLADSDTFGRSIANVGNLALRGGRVIAVGADGDDTGGNNRGAIYLLSYNSSGTLTGTTKVAHGTTNGPTLADSANFGNSIADVGDLDGGGGRVIAVGASGDDTGGSGRGAVYLLSYR